MKNLLTVCLIITVTLFATSCELNNGSSKKSLGLLGSLIDGMQNPNDLVLFTGKEGPECITINDIISLGNNDGYIIRWAPVNDQEIVSDPDTLSWTESSPVLCEDDRLVDYSIQGLTPEQGYIIAVVPQKGKNAGKPLYLSSEYVSLSIEKAKILFPYKKDLFEAVPDVTVLSNGTNSITVANLYTPSVRRYRIYWREKDGEKDAQWQRLDIDATKDEQQLYAPVSYTIEGLKPWTSYHIRVSALTMSGLEGFVLVKDAETQAGDIIADILVVQNNPLKLILKIDSLPDGATAELNLTAKINLTENLGDTLLWKPGWPIPLLVPYYAPPLSKTISLTGTYANSILIYSNPHECHNISVFAVVVIKNSSGSFKTLAIDRSF